VLSFKSDDMKKFWDPKLANILPSTEDLFKTLKTPILEKIQFTCAVINEYNS